MTDAVKPTMRHSTESEILRRALDGNAQAADKFLKYLSSANPHLNQIMHDAIHDLDDPRIWQYLLYSLALHSWNDHVDCDRRSDSSASERIDQALIKVFTIDETDWEKPLKSPARIWSATGIICRPCAIGCMQA